MCRPYYPAKIEDPKVLVEANIEQKPSNHTNEDRQYDTRGTLQDTDIPENKRDSMKMIITCVKMG